MKSRLIKVLALGTSALSMALVSGCTSTAAAGGTTSESSPAIMIGYVAFLFLALYFLMIRPEKKRKKKAEDMRASLTVGDQITTIGGIVGKIVHIKDESIVLETGEDRVRIEFMKWAIGTTGNSTDKK